MSLVFGGLCSPFVTGGLAGSPDLLFLRTELYCALLSEDMADDPFDIDPTQTAEIFL